MKAIRFDPEALEELDEAIAVYDQQREGRGMKFRLAVGKAEVEIQQSPKAWPKYRRSRCREYIVRRFPYAIYYQEGRDDILIVAVAHAKRQEGYWRKRLR
jgi:toxin ParE1/3/4